MILFWIILVVTIISWILFAVFQSGDIEIGASICAVLALIGTIVSMVGILLLGNRDVEAERFLEERNYYSELVTNMPANVSFKTVERTIGAAKYINKRIERNKKYCDNKFYGYFYYKEIAGVEPIAIPDLNVNVTWSTENKNERDL